MPKLTYYNEDTKQEIESFLKSEAKNNYPAFYNAILTDLTDSGQLSSDLFLNLARDCFFSEDYNRISSILWKNAHVLKNDIVKDYVDYVFSTQIKREREVLSPEDLRSLIKSRAKHLKEDSLKEFCDGDKLFFLCKGVFGQTRLSTMETVQSFFGKRYGLLKHFGLTFDEVGVGESASPYHRYRQSSFYKQGYSPDNTMIVLNRGSKTYYPLVMVLRLNYLEDFRAIQTSGNEVDFFVEKEHLEINNMFKYIKKSYSDRKDFCVGLSIFNSLLNGKLEEDIHNLGHLDSRSSRILTALSHGDALIKEFKHVDFKYPEC